MSNFNERPPVSNGTMPYEWLKQIPTALLQLDEIPLVGYALPFPWEELSKKIGEQFQVPDFKLSASPFEWRSPDQLYTGFGDHLNPLTCHIPSLEGTLTWVMAFEDVSRLMALLLNDVHHQHDILEEEFLQGFYHFIAYETIHYISQLPFGHSLSPQIQQQGTLPEEASLCCDVTIHIRNRDLVGRLFISPSLRRSWKEKHAERSLELPLDRPLAEKLSLSVHLEVGKVSITPSLWKSLHPGDFILLDSCTIRPNDEKGGRITLTVNNLPFFIGKLKDGNIKILDHPLYYQEEETFMTSSVPPKKPSDEHDDSSIEFDADSEFESDLDSEFESDLESEKESEMEESHEEESILEMEEEEEPSPEDTSEKANLNPPETPLKIEDIPLSVVIEVGRLQMSVKKMLELQPGNLLELDIHPENGVDLVVNGKRIAKGELIKLGEALGVRILDIS
ncbi:MAG: hypothetical protein BGO14_09790 [Chlamydiales bacterium 38-26]|nr:MAG: hypothetical protein BGO14_09790 [Chlamydiales bacterium 38-26]